MTAGFIPEALQAWKDYKECDTVSEPNAALVCREATKLEYYDAVKTRFADIGNAVKGLSLNLLKLPICLFTEKI